jgi:hypothetical protein
MVESLWEPDEWLLNSNFEFISHLSSKDRKLSFVLLSSLRFDISPKVATLKILVPEIVLA